MSTRHLEGTALRVDSNWAVADDSADDGMHQRVRAEERETGVSVVVDHNVLEEAHIIIGIRAGPRSELDAVHNAGDTQWPNVNVANRQMRSLAANLGIR